MKIEKKLTGAELTITLTGRLDSATSALLEADLTKSIAGVERLIFDFSSLEYVSSAGLRILLAAQKVMNKQGSMVVRNVNETVYEIFEITGFADVLTLE